jgi:hypothetical protein
MAYKISLSNGSSLLGDAGVTDGTLDTTSTSLSLIGKNYPGYGIFLNENFVQLLENFASSTSPRVPLPGQIWFDSGTRAVKVNTGAQGRTPSWKQLASIYSGTIAPTISLVTGDQWWDTGTKQLKVYGGTPTIGWVTVGPLSSTTAGQVGIFPREITGISNNISSNHSVISFTLGTTTATVRTIAILSKDLEFTPVTAQEGFTTIKPGFNLNSGVNLDTIPLFNGVATSARALLVNGNLVTADSFARNDQVSTLVFPISTTNSTIISGGPRNDFSITVDVNDNVGVFNNNNGKDTIFYSNIAGLPVAVFKANGQSGRMEVTQSPTSNAGVASKFYVDNLATQYIRRDGSNTISGTLVPDSDKTYNLGSTANWFNDIFGQSYKARYADLAERFASDQEYPAGTVVELGGTAEITRCMSQMSESVLGVISTDAAYLMNAGAGPNTTHPPVAVAGRVPVNVIGIISKGDRLVSAGNGQARAAAGHEITPWNVIGRSLEEKSTIGASSILALVRINT